MSLKQQIEQIKNDRKMKNEIIDAKIDTLKKVYKANIITGFIIGSELAMIRPWCKELGRSFASICEKVGFSKSSGYRYITLFENKETLEMTFGNDLSKISIREAISSLEGVSDIEQKVLQADLQRIRTPEYKKLLDEKQKKREEKKQKIMDSRIEKQLKAQQKEEQLKKSKELLKLFVEIDAVKQQIHNDRAIALALQELDISFETGDTIAETEEKEDRIPVRSERSNPPDLNIPKSNNNDTTSINGERSVIITNTNYNITPPSDIKTPDVNTNNRRSRRGNNGRPQRNRTGRFARD